MTSKSLAGSVLELGEDLEYTNHPHRIQSSGCQSSIVVPVLAQGDRQVVVDQRNPPGQMSPRLQDWLVIEASGEWDRS